MARIKEEDRSANGKAVKVPQGPKRPCLLDTPWPLEGPPSKGCLGALSRGHGVALS